MSNALAAGAALLVAVILTGTAAPAGDAMSGRMAAGERAFQKCYACHDIARGRNSLSGPTLHSILGRPIAAEPGFRYSPALLALAKSEGRWSAGLLDRFVADPEAVAPGTAMTFTGMRNAGERAQLIQYLRTLGASRR
jgi:cytochrome c